MTGKADFNAEEWSTVLEGPPLAGMIVITAQRGGTLRESISMAKVYAEARQQHSSDGLLEEIVSAQPEFDRTRYHSAEELRQQGLERLRQAVQLIEQKGGPEEAEVYKRFVLTVGQRAAEAHREGGFMGFGGKDVSDAEQAALDQIAGALGIGTA